MQRRHAEHGRAAQPAELLGVVDPPEPADPIVRPVLRPQRRRVGTVARDPQARVARQHGERLEQHCEPLSLLVTPAEEDRRRRRGHRPGVEDRGDVDAVEENSVFAPAEVRADQLEGVLRHDNLHVDGPQHPRQQRFEHAVALRVPGSVERRHERCPAHHVGGERRAGRERLVHVEYVELLVAQDPDRAHRGGRVGGERCDGAVGRRRQAVPQRRDEAERRRTVARPEHPRLVPGAPELAGEPEHLCLYPAGDAQAVGRHQPDAQEVGHRVRGVPRSQAHRSGARGSAER